MKRKPLLSGKPRLKNCFLLCFSMMILALVLSSYRQPVPGQAKIKFTSMLLSKSNLDYLTTLPDFSYFVFQNANTSGSRSTYELVVYAYNSKGEKLNPNIELLTKALKQPTPPVNERTININFCNYKMTKRQYEAIIGTAVFENLKFIAAAINNGHTYPNYITYEVYPVDKDEKVIPPFTIKLLTEDNYLKPSPPAPPEP